VIGLLAQVPFPNEGWLTNPRTHERMVEYTIEHIQLTALSVPLGLLIAFPLAVLAVRRRRLHAPLLTATGVIYTIPSLAMFLLLYGVLGVGFGYPVAVTGLALYSLIVLFRNTVAGLDSVPSDAREAGEAMGHSRRQMLWRVEVPLALPVLFAGLRIATVSTIGLVTITALIGMGGIGRFFLTGATRRDPTILLVAIVMVVALAFVFDVLIVLARRIALPWAREVDA
jgi:osmoprotectant transport system permease protein